MVQIGITQQLEYFQSLIDAFLSPKTAKKMTERMQLIKSKSEDNRLYLALVGEFSSGKSTFINALLGQRVLKEAVTPTTACATYIEKSRKGVLLIEAGLGEKRFKANEQQYTKIKDYIKTTYGIEAKNLQHLIDILTSDQVVAREVTDLHLYIPGTDLPDGLTLIDTPGFNPGSESVNNHFEITQHVVTQIADAAIVLMPSYAPFSASIRNFMLDNLQRYLHRCVFVLTRADETFAESRNETINFVKQHLVSDLHLPDAPLFFESAITMLPVVRIPESKQAEWKMWQKEFLNFEHWLWEKLSQQSHREIILSEHLHNLSIDFISELQEALKQKQNILEKQKAVLEKEKVGHIRDVSSQMVLSVSSNIKENVLILKKRVTDETKKAEDEVKEYVQSKDVQDFTLGYHTDALTKIKEKVKQKNDETTRLLNVFIKESLQPCVDRNMKKMQEIFTSHYATFPSLRYTVDPQSIALEQITPPDLSFNASAEMISQVSDKEFNKDMRTTGKYAAIGAGIGTIIPGIGTLFGAGAGAAFGFIKSIVTAKTDVSDLVKIDSAVNTEVSCYFNELKNKYFDNIDRIIDNVNAMIQDYGEQHVNIYGEKVAELIHQREVKQQQTQNSIDSLKEKIRTLEDIELQNKYHLAILKSKN